MPVQFRPAQVDFSMLSKLPELFQQGQDKQRENAFNNAFSDPNSYMTNGQFDPAKAAKLAFSSGESKTGLALLAAANKNDDTYAATPDGNHLLITHGPNAGKIISVGGENGTGAPTAGGTPVDQTIPTVSPKGLLAKAPTPPNPPAGYIWKDPNDPSKGFVIPPNSPALKLPENAAGALSMGEAAVQELNTPMPGGGVLRDELTKPYTAGYGPAHFERDITLQRGDVGRAARAVRQQIEAALRMMTGAAAPQEEVDRYAGFYMPGVTDTEKTAQQKLRLLDDFTAKAKQAMTQGRSMEPSGGLQTAKDQSRFPGSQAPSAIPVPTYSVSPNGEIGGATQANAGELNVPPVPGAINGPVVQGPGAAPQTPPPKALNALKAYANNPQARAAFDEIYGPGAAEFYLTKGR